MCMQISDDFFFNGKEWYLAGISEGELFEPQSVGLFPQWHTTACYQGYQAVYSVFKGNLVLKDLNVNLGKRAPKINGVAPRYEKSGGGFCISFDNNYSDINLKLEYSGGILLADDPIRELCDNLGFMPAWKYRTVTELIFEKGELVKKTDCSEKIAEIRDTMVFELPSGEFVSLRREQAEITERIRAAFDRSYWS